ncbi:hypothetical protein ACHABQ_05490 [Nesterenkonia aurantiaca]|uniref:hypothetical protein n=1 Tax=Nesterenkonia aurantiaca TaxID=1436010 RepID=UPI003EE43E42
MEFVREQQGLFRRAERDYNAENTEGDGLKRIKWAASTRIDERECDRLLNRRAGALISVVGTPDLARPFRRASLDFHREVIDIRTTVTLLPQARGGRASPGLGAHKMGDRG